MRGRTVVALSVVLLVLVGGVVAVTLGGTTGGVSERWVSDTGTSIGANHHAVAAARIGDGGLVYAPVSGSSDTDECRLAALHAANGTAAWTVPVPSEHCTIHAVADPAVADFDGDGVREVLASSTTDELRAFHPTTGAEELSVPLSEYGYTRPAVVDLDGDGESAVVVVDVDGSVFSYAANGTLQWRQNLSGTTYAPPVVGDLTGDGTTEFGVALGTSTVAVFDAGGERVWEREAFGESVGWTASADLDEDGSAEFVVATTDGTVAAFDGATGEVIWKRSIGPFAAVHAIGDGDDDGDLEVYATNRAAELRALDGETGTVEWETTLTNERVQMTPPPSLGDVDGDGDGELVAPTNDGLVSVVDPADGSVIGTYDREVSIFTHATLADTDDDGAAEVYVMYGDGRVVALHVSG